MYLRLTRARFDPALADQIAPLASEVRTAMQRLPGLQHNHQGIDRGAGTIAAVSVWDSAAHAGFAREALGDPIGRLRALGVQFEPPEIYEIMDDAG
jgi:phage tail tape-measure protein